MLDWFVNNTDLIVCINSFIVFGLGVRLLMRSDLSGIAVVIAGGIVGTGTLLRLWKRNRK